MNEMLLFITAALQITLLDIVLSGDNVGLIALAIRNLPKEQAKLASLAGVTGAIVFRILFASIFTTLITIQWIPLKLIGGLLLLKITWDLVKSERQQDQPDEDEEKRPRNVPEQPTVPDLSDGQPGAAATADSSTEEGPAGTLKNPGFLKAVSTIILADLSMSLDNVLAVGGAANGNIGLIAFGIALNLPLLFFGSQYVAGLMNKHRIIIYFGAAVLMHTSLAMILADNLLLPYIPRLVGVILPWIPALGVLIRGYRITRKKPVSEGQTESKQNREQACSTVK